MQFSSNFDIWIKFSTQFCSFWILISCYNIFIAGGNICNNNNFDGDGTKNLHLVTSCNDNQKEQNVLQRARIAGSQSKTKCRLRSDRPSIDEDLALKTGRPSIAGYSAFRRRNAIVKKLGTRCYNNPPVDLKRFEGIARTPDSNCSAPFVTVNDGGRLGNQICDLMSLWIFRKHFGMRIMISKKSQYFLKKLFSKVFVYQGSDNCFKFDQEGGNTLFKFVYENFNQSLDLIKNGTPLLSPKIEKQNFISGYPCALDHFLMYRDELRSLFVFRPDLIKKVKYRLKTRLEKKNLSRSSVTLVSAHVRRTDYIKYIWRYYKTSVPEKEFYIKSFDLYNKRFDSVVFVVVSDDIDWCKKNFGGYNVIYPGTSNTRDPSIDYATITLCDHHIIGFGTFSFTSAFLGRGTIAYDASNKALRVARTIIYLCSDPRIYIPV